MLKYEINEKRQSALEAIGNCETLVADTMVLIKRLYDGLKEGPGEEVAETFRKLLARCLIDRTSPIFEENGKR